MRSRANIEFSKLVEFNLNLILRVTLTLSLDLLCLLNMLVDIGKVGIHDTNLIQKLGRSTVGQHAVSKAET